MVKVAQQWTEHEFAGLDLGDAGLDRRAKKLIERLAERPAASIPKACDRWSETVAAYRFLRNSDVAWEGILAPHWARAGADACADDGTVHPGHHGAGLQCLGGYWAGAAEL
jgi:hypothetical protein